MSRGNDAIPSWSGYNYQGKITLLATLIKINNLLQQGIDLNDGMYVEIERYEDFIIYEGNKANSIYQVKAYLSTTKVSSYASAMEKLIRHRNEISAVGADCFLCTPLDIEDWNDDSNIYMSTILIYKPYGTCVGLDKVPSLIVQEIEKTLKLKGLSSDNKNDIYLELCNYLDKKVSNLHSQNKKNREYQIFFRDISEFILDKNKNIIVTDEAKQKEKVYNHIITDFKNAVDNYCNSYCVHKQNKICHNEVYGICSLYKSYEFITNINIWDYCRYINPHVNDGWDNPLNYISNMNTDTFSTLLLPVFNTIMTESMESSNNIIYCDTNIYDTDGCRVIPTLLTFYSGLISSEAAVQEKLDKIKRNSFVFSGLEGNIITAETHGITYNTESDSILAYEGVHKDRIQNLRNAIQIIDSKKFIDKLRGMSK